MAKKQGPESPLVLAAAALDAQVERFKENVGAFDKLRLDSKKNLDRATKMLNELAEAETGMGAQVQALVQAIAAVREAQGAAVETVRAKAEQVKARAVVFQELLARSEELGAAAGALNGKLQASGPDVIDLPAELAALAAKAEALQASAREQEFDDVARLGDGLKQQLNSMRQRLEKEKRLPS